MSEILCGNVNPSGKTVDAWMTDIMEDPSMSNFGNAEYENLYLLQGGYPNPVGDSTEMNFIEYEENIYVGYVITKPSMIPAEPSPSTVRITGPCRRRADAVRLWPELRHRLQPGNRLH